MNSICFSLNFNSEFTWVSANLEERSGWKPEEVIGHNIFEYMPKECHAEIITARIGRVTGITQTYLTKVYLKDMSISKVRIRILQTPENIVGAIDRREEIRE